MKLLLDSCVWGWPADPGDEAILARALAEGRVLVNRAVVLAQRFRVPGVAEP